MVWYAVLEKLIIGFDKIGSIVQRVILEKKWYYYFFLFFLVKNRLIISLSQYDMLFSEWSDGLALRAFVSVRVGTPLK